MTYEGRLELHLRHLKQGKKSPYADDFKDYVEPEIKEPEKDPMEKIAEKVEGQVVEPGKTEATAAPVIDEKKEVEVKAKEKPKKKVVKNTKPKSVRKK